MDFDAVALPGLPLFDGLTARETARLHSLLHSKTFPTGTAVCSEDQWGEVAYIILTGTVKVQREQADGKETILAILGPGQLVGELSILDHEGRSATVVTLEPSHLLWLNRPDFESCLTTMPRLTLNLARILARRLRLANAHIQSLASQDVFGRVAHLLLTFVEDYGRSDTSGNFLIPLHLTQTEMASLVGASRVRVNHVLSFYRDRNYISIDFDSHITIHNRAALAERCGYD